MIIFYNCSATSFCRKSSSFAVYKFHEECLKNIVGSLTRKKALHIAKTRRCDKMYTSACFMLCTITFIAIYSLAWSFLNLTLYSMALSRPWEWSHYCSLVLSSCGGWKYVTCRSLLISLVSVTMWNQKEALKNKEKSLFVLETLLTCWLLCFRSRLVVLRFTK